MFFWCFVPRRGRGFGDWESSQAQPERRLVLSQEVTHHHWGDQQGGVCPSTFTMIHAISISRETVIQNDDLFFCSSPGQRNPSPLGKGNLSCALSQPNHTRHTQEK